MIVTAIGYTWLHEPHISADSKKNSVHIWLAIDPNSRKIIGCYIGDRTRKSARKLWASLPEIYQQSAFSYTDFWQAYKKVIPPERHRIVEHQI